MRPDLHRYFITLGLSPGASADDIRGSYRKLIQEWHPDRFAAGSLMQTTAEDHTKDLNEAYENLYKKRLYRKFLGMTPAKPRAAPAEPAAEPEATATPPEPRRPRRASDAAPRHEPPPTPPPPKPSFFRSRRFWKGTVLGAAVAAAAFVLVPRIAPWLGALTSAPPKSSLQADVPSVTPPAAVATAVPASTPTSPEGVTPPRTAIQVRLAPVSIKVVSSSLATLAAPTASVPVTTGTPSAQLGDVALTIGRAGTPDPLRPAPAAVTTSVPASIPTWTFPSADSGLAVDAALTRTLSGAELDRRLNEAETHLDTFEAGDSPERVKAVQGSPDEAVAGAFRYGSSMVYFEKDRVSGWVNGVPRLRIPSLFDSDLQDEIDAFTLGSTRGEVFQVQGRPDQVSGDAYTYGMSTVFFENDRVVSWIRGDQRLRTRLLPELPFLSPP